MKINLTPISKGLAILFTGLLAGTFYYATSNVLPTFSEVPDNIHLAFRTALMRHNSLNMQLLMGMSIVTGSLLAWQVRHTRPALYCAASASLLALTSLLVTRFGNVPINMLIKTWDISHPPLDWQNTLTHWSLFHYIRTYSAIGSFVFTIIATHIETSILSSIKTSLRGAEIADVTRL
jgi:uncharacterized membrane protein